jgi:hypothetical protein
LAPMDTADNGKAANSVLHPWLKHRPQLSASP